MRGGTLLKNYGHVFAVMMRLRQLCCHRELLPIKWHVSFRNIFQIAFFVFAGIKLSVVNIGSLLKRARLESHLTAFQTDIPICIQFLQLFKFEALIIRTVKVAIWQATNLAVVTIHDSNFEGFPIHVL